jgi:hypothetical protein
MRSVEPEGDSDFAPKYSDDPLDDGLLTELQHVLGMDADGVEQWLAEHGPAAARAEYFAAWGGRGE